MDKKTVITFILTLLLSLSTSVTTNIVTNAEQNVRIEFIQDKVEKSNPALITVEIEHIKETVKKQGEALDKLNKVTQELKTSDAESRIIMQGLKESIDKLILKIDKIN